jgi:DNA-directed RNA polymerase subunit RPC12/RpoP
MTTLKCSLCETLVISDVFEIDDVITCKECW